MEWTIHWEQTMHDEEIDMGGEECEGYKEGQVFKKMSDVI